MVLKKHGRWRGAVSLAGYSIECLLKWKLMKKFEFRHLAELEVKLGDRKRLRSEASIFTHDNQRLLRLADENRRLSHNADCWKAFNIFNEWTSEWRYTSDRSKEEDATHFFDAVEKVSSQPHQNTRGVSRMADNEIKERIKSVLQSK